MQLFCCFLLILLSLCLYSLLPAFIEMGCSLKKNLLYHYLVFQWLLQFLCSMFDNLSRLKLLLVYLQCLLIHYFDDCCLFIERLSRCWSCLVLIFGSILVALLRVQYQICKCFFFCFCLGYIHFGNMFGTVYYFLVY